MNVQSIRFRLIFWHAGLLAAAFFILASFIFFGVKFYLEDSFGENHLRWAKQIGSTLQIRINESRRERIEVDIKGRFAPEANRRFIRVTSPDGTSLYTSGPPDDRSFVPSAVPKPTRQLSQPITRKIEAGDSVELMVVGAPVATTQGLYIIESGAPLDTVQDYLDRLLFWLCVSFPILLGLSITGGHLLINAALAPVEKTCCAAEEITLQNLSRRLPVSHSGDELERLSIAMNLMIARLDEAFGHNRRFMADASHEMRTPLTVIRGELEALTRDPKLSGDAKAVVGSILEEAESLARIVESLFTIARLDAGEGHVKWTRFDLAKTASSTAEQMLLMAEDKGITVSFEGANPVEMEGDQPRIKQVIVNLLDNAIKYTQPGGRINIYVAAAGEKAILEVSDNGIGIPLEAQPHIFERFYRVDKARSRDQGGAGLGLAIAKAICAAHRGSIEVQSSDGWGSRFRVELPISFEMADLPGPTKLPLFKT